MKSEKTSKNAGSAGLSSVQRAQLALSVVLLALYVASKLLLPDFFEKLSLEYLEFVSAAEKTVAAFTEIC